MASLLKNPLNSGTPQSAIVPIKNVQYVLGIRSRRPPILQMSCS